MGRLTKYGLDHMEDDVLGTCMSAKYSNCDLLDELVDNGAMPRVSDIMLAVKWRRWPEFRLLCSYLLEDDIVNIDDNSRSVLVDILMSRSTDHKDHRAMVDLLSKGLPLKAQDFKLASKSADLPQLGVLIDFITPQLAVELNFECPNILDHATGVSEAPEIEPILMKFVEKGVVVTVDNVENAFTARNAFATDIR